MRQVINQLGKEPDEICKHHSGTLVDIFYHTETAKIYGVPLVLNILANTKD